ncbi:DinB family protein [Spirosoma aerolatum]|uniref:DinB family protein n=1 Tax=Spirosoma aerolatum TaxID=1211326 RepID=UPI0009AE3F33|nr:DinB family protein [Spirosoma aerolatum]
MEDRRYPIGPFSPQSTYTSDELSTILSTIADSPAQYQAITSTLTPDDLTKTYRAGSWTVQQLIHHVSDIQFLHFFRMKKALTESDYTTLTLIDMDAWANTTDVTTASIDGSIRMLEGITPRYVRLGQTLTDAQLAIQYYHPVREYWINQAQALAMSAWHLQHHLAHIRLALPTT